MRLSTLVSGIVCAGLSFSFISSAQAFGWHHGIEFGLHSYSADADIEFYNKTALQISPISESFSAESSGQRLNNLFAIEGYSTNHLWLWHYSYSQYETQSTPTDNLAYDLSGSNLQVLAGYRLLELSQAIRLYGQFGGQYRKQKFKHKVEGVTQSQLSDSGIKPLVGLQLDIPMTKKLVGHINLNSELSSGDASTQASFGLNLRTAKHWTILAEYQINQLKVEKTGKQTSYYTFDGDLNRLSLKAVFIW